MSAATTIFVVVMMIATLMIVSATFMITSSAVVSTTTCQMLDQVLNLFLSGFAVLNYLSSEVQQFACHRVVGIYCHTVFLNLHDLCHKLMILIVHQSNGGSLEDILVVEMSVDHENAAIQFVLTLWHVFAKGLAWLQGEIKVLALLQTAHFLLETVE